jgi:hypothetical protein
MELVKKQAEKDPTKENKYACHPGRCCGKK